MDERDKEWLDKNNEEARGEGTSAQGAISASGTRTSARSAKAKGKEPDVSQPVVITEDEFELVMGLFEKVTHEKTEFLHHVCCLACLPRIVLTGRQALETGMPFPAFTEYQDTFSSPIPPSAFASHVVPKWIQEHQGLSRIARVIYPYWKERRIERGGHRIIPTLNFDESDTLNESYICFRRREIKAVRKTRQAQVSSSDKLIRLQGEFAYPLELARQVLQRETLKKEQGVQAQQLWERRMALADLKRKFPSLSDKSDEELLIDKERPVKRPEPPRLPGVKIPPNNALLQPLRPDPVIKPRERIQQVREKYDQILARRKEEDKIWEDVIDVCFILFQITVDVDIPCRVLNNPPTSPMRPSSSNGSPQPPHQPFPPTVPPTRHLTMKTANHEPPSVYDTRVTTVSSLIVANSVLLVKSSSVLGLRCWRVAASLKRTMRKILKSKIGGSGNASVGDSILMMCHHRLGLKRKTGCWSTTSSLCMYTFVLLLIEILLILPSYLRHSMTLLRDSDHLAELTTDPTLILPTSDGRQQSVIPYRLGMPQMVRPAHMRPPHPGMPPGMTIVSPGQPGQPGIPVGTPVSMQGHLKKMQPPTAIPQMRISNGGMRPPSLPGAGLNGTSASQPATPQPVPIPPAHMPTNGVNGGGRAAIAMPHVEMVKPAEALAAVQATPAVSAIDASAQQAPATQEAANGAAAGASATASSTNGAAPQAVAKQQAGGVTMSIPNGFHVGVAPVNPSQTPATFVAGNFQPMNNANVNGVAAVSVNGGIPVSTNGVNGTGVPVNGANAAAAAMNLQKMDFKSVFANMPAQQLAQLRVGAFSQNFIHAQNGVGGVGGVQGMGVNGAGAMKLPPGAVRQLHYALGAGMQRPSSAAMNVSVDGTVGVNGAGVGVGQNAAHLIPVRSPSGGAMRQGMRVAQAGMALGSPHLGVGQAGQQANAQGQQGQQGQGQGPNASPGRGVSMTPSMGVATPPIQHQQPVGSTQNGY